MLTEDVPEACFRFLTDLDAHRVALPRVIDACSSPSMRSAQHNDHVTERKRPSVKVSTKPVEWRKHCTGSDRTEEEAGHRKQE
jgi:hypothetical protein